METLSTIAQIIIALGIYNVWLLRFSKSTNWRGGNATNMREEFQTYGLPPVVLYIVGFLKLIFATLLLIGIAFPVVVQPAAAGMAALMLGAIGMHVRVGDPAKRSLPAAVMLLLSIVVLV